MGSSSGDRDERPVHRVNVQTFQLSRAEVTVAQYRACVQAGGCTAPQTGDGCNWSRSGADSDPINCVTWHQAAAFATWIGARLPSEAEWEFAARSRGKRWAFPWGSNSPTCNIAIFDDKITRAPGSGGTDGCGRYSTWPVCSRPAGNSRQGVCDLAGSVWEWVADPYHGSYRGAPSTGRVWSGGDGSKRVARGGSWSSLGKHLRATNRYRKPASYQRYDVGFRVAR